MVLSSTFITLFSFYCTLSLFWYAKAVLLRQRFSLWGKPEHQRTFQFYSYSIKKGEIKEEKVTINTPTSKVREIKLITVSEVLSIFKIGHYNFILKRCLNNIFDAVIDLNNSISRTWENLKSQHYQDYYKDKPIIH